MHPELLSPPARPACKGVELGVAKGVMDLEDMAKSYRNIEGSWRVLKSTGTQLNP